MIYKTILDYIIINEILISCKNLDNYKSFYKFYKIKDYY